MIEEEKIEGAKEKNRRIFPIYKMFAWDLLFYYSISFLFLNQEKGLSASDIFLGDSFYAMFKILSQPLIFLEKGKLILRETFLLQLVFYL